MSNIVNKELSENQDSFYKDQWGRGWKTVINDKMSQRCYILKCNSIALVEMIRGTVNLQRREYLCGKCFNARAKEWKLTKVVKSKGADE